VLSGDDNYDRTSKELKLVLRQMLSISISMEKFFKDVKRYPTTPEGLTILVKNTNDWSNWKGPYIDKETLNLFFKGNITKDKWGNEFIYLCPPQYLFGNNPYNLYSKGKNQLDDHTKKDDIANWGEINLTFYEEADLLMEIGNLLMKLIPFLILILVLLKFFLKRQASRVR
jgi:hypothetical protein